MPVNVKKTEFAPAGVQAGRSSSTFHPEAIGAAGKVQSKILYRLKHKVLHLQSMLSFRVGIRTKKLQNFVFKLTV